MAWRTPASGASFDGFEADTPSADLLAKLDSVLASLIKEQ